MSKTVHEVGGRQIREPGLSHARGATRGVLYVIAGSGLGNRLRAWLGYRAMSLCCGVPFYLYWQRSWSCDAEFDRLFEPPPFPVVNMRDCYRMLVRDEVDGYLHAYWCDDIWQAFAEDAVGWDQFMSAVRQSLAEIRFRQDLVAAADRFARVHHLSERIGIHIRHTDNLGHYRVWDEQSDGFARHKTSTPAGFFRAMDRLASRHRFFVATDSAAIAQEIRERYAARACMLPKEFRSLSAEQSRTTTVEAAVTELILLGRCRKVIGTYFSSFSRMSAILGGCDYWEIQGTACVRDPTFPTRSRRLNCRIFRSAR